MNRQVVFQGRGDGGHEGWVEVKTNRERRRGKTLGFILLLLVLFFVVAQSLGWLVDWLWMKEVGYTTVFLRLFSIRTGLFFVTFVVALLYLWINLRIAAGPFYLTGAPIRIAGLPHRFDVRITPWITKAIMIVLSLVPALFFGLALLSASDTWLRYWWGGPFGQTDPFFGKDLGFYLFRLPLYIDVRNGWSVLTFLALPITFLGYLITGQIGFPFPRFQAGRASTHLTILFVLFLVAWGTGYYLDIFQLFYQKRGAVFGMGYTSYHVERVSLWVMMAATLFLAVLAIFKRTRPWLILGGHRRVPGGYASCPRRGPRSLPVLRRAAQRAVPGKTVPRKRRSP